MATRLWGPNKKKALRNIGVAKVKQAQAMKQARAGTYGLGVLYGNTKASGHQAATPFIKLQATGRPDTVETMMWSDNYNYAGTKFEGDNIVTKVKYGEDGLAYSSQQAIRFDEDDEEYYPAPGHRDSLALQLAPHIWYGHKMMVRAGFTNPLALSFSRYGQPSYNGNNTTLYATTMRVETESRTIVGPTTLDAAGGCKLDGYIVGHDPIGNRLFLWNTSESEEIINYQSLNTPSYWNAIEDETISRVFKFNKAGNKCAALYIGHPWIPGQEGIAAYTVAGIEEYELKLVELPNDKKELRIATLQDTILFDSRDQTEVYPIVLDYNAESEENEIVIAYVQASISTPFSPNTVNPSAVDPPGNASENPYYWYPQPLNSRIYTLHADHVHGWSLSLSFKSQVHGEILLRPFHLMNIDPQNMVGLRACDVYIRGDILALDASCRGVTIMTRGVDIPGGVIYSWVNWNGVDKIPGMTIPTTDDFLEIKTTAYGFEHTIVSRGTPVDVTTAIPGDYTLVQDTLVDMDSLYVSIWYTKFGGITSAYQTNMFGHPHKDRKLWVVSIDPDDVWKLNNYYPYEFDDVFDPLYHPSQGSPVLEDYPEDYITAINPTVLNYGGVYGKDGEEFNFKEQYDEIYDSQRDIITAGGDVSRELPELKLGTRNTLSTLSYPPPHWYWYYSKYGTGAIWAIYTAEPTPAP